MEEKRIVFAPELFISLNSRQVAAGGIFVAAQGMREHGVHYIVDALERGAREIVVDHSADISEDIKNNISKFGATLTQVVDARRAVAEMSAAYYQHPAQSLHVIGITGTKGKTTTAYLVRHMLRSQGYRTALLGTVENLILDTAYKNDLTTPQADYLHAFMRAAVDQGVTHLVMEVAAQAMTMQRTFGLLYHQVVWLNFAQEHGEFYATSQDYFQAKSLLLDQVHPQGCITVCADDPNIYRAAQQRSGKKRFFTRHDVTLHAVDVAQAMSWYAVSKAIFPVQNLYGAFNGENIAAALQVADHIGIDKIASIASLESFSGVPGRMNWYQLSNGARACIDYAHTPNSFEAVLSELRRHTEHLIVVFGAGGERDKAKRPCMGNVAAQYADVVILTSDNPRSERVEDIISDIQQGIKGHNSVQIVINREQAIREAYRLSRASSIIALLGKGPDEYQIVSGAKRYFSERSILASL